MIIRLALVSSSTDSSKYKRKLGRISNVSLRFNSRYLKLLVFQSKVSGTRKFTLRYQEFEININLEISRVDRIHQKQNCMLLSFPIIVSFVVLHA